MNFTVLNFILTQIGKRGCSLVTYSTVNPFPLVSWFGVQGCTMAESRLCCWAWDPAGGTALCPVPSSVRWATARLSVELLGVCLGCGRRGGPWPVRALSL